MHSVMVGSRIAGRLEPVSNALFHTLACVLNFYRHVGFSFSLSVALTFPNPATVALLVALVGQD
jgi:hypothetical protein